MHVAATSSSSASQSPQSQLFSSPFATQFGRTVEILTQDSDPKLDVALPLLDQNLDDDLDSSQIPASSSLTQSPNIGPSGTGSPFRSEVDFNLNADLFDEYSRSSIATGITPNDEAEACSSSQTLQFSLDSTQLFRLKRLAFDNGHLLRKFGISAGQIWRNGGEETVTIAKNPHFPSSASFIKYPSTPRALKFAADPVREKPSQKRALPSAEPIIKPELLKYESADMPSVSESPMLVTLLSKGGPPACPDPYAQGYPQPMPPNMMAPPRMPNANECMLANENVYQAACTSSSLQNGHINGSQPDTAPSPKKQRKSRAKKPKEEPKKAVETAPPTPINQPMLDYYMVQSNGQPQRVPNVGMHAVQQYRVQYPQQYPQNQQMVRGFVQHQYPQQVSWSQSVGDDSQGRPVQMRVHHQPQMAGQYNGMMMDERLANGQVHQLSPHEMEFRRQQQMRMQQMQQQQRVQEQMKYSPHMGTSRPMPSQQFEQPHDTMFDFKIKTESEDVNLDSIEPFNSEPSEKQPKPKSGGSKKSNKNSKKQADQNELDALHKAMNKDPNDPTTPPPVPIPEAQQRMIGNAIDCVMERVCGEKSSSSSREALGSSQPQAPGSSYPPPPQQHSNQVTDLPQEVPQAAFKTSVSYAHYHQTNPNYQQYQYQQQKMDPQWRFLESSHDAGAGAKETEMQDIRVEQ